MDKDLKILMMEFGLMETNLITEDTDDVMACAPWAKDLALTCDGYQPEIDEYYMSDDHHIVSDKYRVSVSAKDINHCIDRMITKIKQFSPTDWIQRVKKWAYMVPNESVAEKIRSYVI